MSWGYPSTHQTLSFIMTTNQIDIEIPEDYLCPINCTIMQDPVFDANGHTYERTAIETWFAQKQTSPITHLTISHTNLTPNIMLKRQILEFVESNHLQNQLNIKRPGRPAIPGRPANLTKPPSYQAPELTLSYSNHQNQVIVDIDSRNQSQSNTNLKHTILLVDESGSMGQVVKINEGGVEKDYGLSLLDLVKHATLTLTIF